MSKLSCSLPLVRIFPVGEVPRVELYLDEPLVISQSSKRRQLGQQVLALVQGMDLLVHKEEQNHSDLSKDISIIYQELENLVQKQGGKYNTTQEYFKDTGLISIYPRVSIRLGINGIVENKSDYEVREHFSHMALMNQIVSTALQLQKDIGLKDHKYIAHQLALLYQGINQVGGGFLKFKSKIETQFDKIKSAISESETPQLNDERKTWLMNITSEIIIDALFKLRPVRAASQPLAGFLNNVAKY